MLSFLSGLSSAHSRICHDSRIVSHSGGKNFDINCHTRENIIGILQLCSVIAFLDGHNGYMVAITQQRSIGLAFLQEFRVRVKKILI